MALLAPLPIAAAAIFAALLLTLRHLPAAGDRHALAPYVATVGLFVLCFAGLAYSFYPYVVPERMTIFEAASAPESLAIMLVGTLIVMPVIGAYSAFSYFVFRGKARELSYD
jgi:cytochrome d ubiquinol oxidase subunit II